MFSNASAIAAVFANSRVRVKPMTGDEGHAQGPLAGQDHSTPGGEDGDRRGRLGDLARETIGADLCSYFQAEAPQGPSPPSSGGRPHGG
jgi:hypothetical protein